MTSNIDASIYSAHAHPRPRPASYDDFGDMQLVFDDIAIELQLTGLPGERRSKVTDLYNPELRRSPYTTTKYINHLDTVSCWKGINLDQATELVEWELIFHEALESHMGRALRDSLAQYLQTHGGGHASIMSCLIQSISVQRVRRLSVDIQRLVHEMITLFYDTCTWPFVRGGWFASSGDLPAMIYNFVRTRDCFSDTPSYTVVQIELNFTHEDSRLCIVGDVSWHSPKISFRKLQSTLEPGEKYQLTPRYTSPDLGSSLGPKFPKFPEETVFTVDSETLPLKWDHDLGCFHAIVPATVSSGEQQDKTGSSDTNKLASDLYGSSRQKYRTETKFTARSEFTFPNNVRFECTARYLLYLDIKEPTDWEHIKNILQRIRSWVPSYTHTPLSKFAGKATEPLEESVIKDRLTTWLSISREKAFQRLRDQTGCQPLPFNDLTSPSSKSETSVRHHSFCELPENCAGGQETCLFKVDGNSPQKRKASKQAPLSPIFDQPPAFEGTRLSLDQFEHLDLELAAKRQKWDECVVESCKDAAIDEADVDKDLDEYLSGIGQSTIWCSGKAHTNPRTTVNYSHWAERLSDSDNASFNQCRSRAYEASLSVSRVVPSLKKKGSVKRMIFPRHEKTDSPQQCITPRKTDSLPSTPCPCPDLPLSQVDIQNNWAEFMLSCQPKTTARNVITEEISSEDDRNAFEDIFLEGSQVGSWTTEAEDLSIEVERVSLANSPA